MTISKRGVSSLFAVLIPLVAFAPLAGSAGPILGSAQRTVHQTGTVARQAQSASRPAKFLTGWPVTSYFTSEDLGAPALTPGFSFSSSAQTLDAKANPNAEPLFQIGKTLDIASDRTLSMVHSNASDEGDWDFGSPLGGNRLLAEHILAGRGIALDAIARILCGRAIAPNPPAKLDTNAISDDCTAINGERSGPTELASLVSQNQNVPEPSTGLLLVAVGLIGVGTRMKRTFT